MLKIHPAPARLPSRLVGAELREVLPQMKRGESVVVPISRSSAHYSARKVGVEVLIEETGVEAGHVRVVRR